MGDPTAKHPVYGNETDLAAAVANRTTVEKALNPSQGLPAREVSCFYRVCRLLCAPRDECTRSWQNLALPLPHMPRCHSSQTIGSSRYYDSL